ncbi:DUF11 domain-containing protein [Streptacidiphilus sp. P02-A3a]|uniref:DUF7927 domain-containing protein n=1 Tax=Streptacidiphilus sp. P02-A3a TaxID=2704468 RepID=UPI0015FB6280|nr:DUF11 domain-containing protein [Streptacidiphilus sp. P02-A3a]QMU71473.1 DUF11 domain-containing protein [Streptacidiphilus sp. P02-A3a]
MRVHDPKITDIVCPRDSLGPMGSPTASMLCTGSHVITVNDSFADTFSNTATAEATSEGGEKVTSNESTAEVPVVRLRPHLVLRKTAEPVRADPGGTVHYTVTAVNSGEVPLRPADFTDDLSGVLDDADYNGDVGATRGTAVVSGQRLAWTGELEPGESVTVTYSVTVHRPDHGDHRLRNSVSTTVPGSECTTGARSRSAVRSEPPCTVDVPVGPNPTPTPTPTATPTTTPSRTATPAPSGGGGPGGLAPTGSAPVAPLVLGAAALLTGLGLLVARATRRRGRHG